MCTSMHYRGEGGDFAGHGIGKGLDVGERHDVVDQAETMRFGGRQEISREQEFHGLGRPNEPHQPPHFAKPNG